jgi:lipopolysaccharide/colanic/teichoic acid biosynthesis glycosyltransferase
MSRYDIDYIDRWSMLLDLKIIARTALAVVARRGAY